MEVTDSPSEHQCSPSSQRFGSHRSLEKDVWVCAPLGARVGALRMGGGGGAGGGRRGSASLLV